jgi:transposase-like protein
MNGVSRRTRTGAASERRVWRCGECRKQFSVLTGTPFHGTKISVRKWVFVIFEMCSSKNGVAAREIERKYGLCPRTAWFMLHRIREVMKGDDLTVQRMEGVIEADETFIGGDPIKMNRKTRAGRDFEAGRGTYKIPVLTLIEKHSGQARSRVFPNVTSANLSQVFKEHVNATRSLLWTDKLPAYIRPGRHFVAHQTVDHGEEEYVSRTTGANTNAAENFFSQLKRSLDGTHHHVSRVHLPRYLAEFDYRYSTRKLTDTARMARLMEQVPQHRLMYKLVTA